MTPHCAAVWNPQAAEYEEPKRLPTALPEDRNTLTAMAFLPTSLKTFPVFCDIKSNERIKQLPTTSYKSREERNPEVDQLLF